jgi:hypothetical protein
LWPCVVFGLVGCESEKKKGGWENFRYMRNEKEQYPSPGSTTAHLPPAVAVAVAVDVEGQLSQTSSAQS